MTTMRVTRSSPTPLSRGEATRARIREAANQLFLRHGVEATTVEAIAAAAGVSKPTFYLYFQCKEDLLLEYGLQRLRRARELLPDLIALPTFRDALNALLDAVVRGKTWGRELTGRAILEIGTSAERLPVAAPHTLLLPLIELGQARGEIRTDIPAETLAHFVLRSILGALSDWGLGADPLDRDRALELAVTLVLDAVARRDDG
jgi:AcrR family transcriptional regulator